MLVKNKLYVPPEILEIIFKFYWKNFQNTKNYFLTSFKINYPYDKFELWSTFQGKGKYDKQEFQKLYLKPQKDFLIKRDIKNIIKNILDLALK